ncbi:MAG: WbqC family protein [Flavobacteriaceae bacterium]|nr:WbqC family protein [Flavobacteriaceae bacterium]
MSVLLHPTYFPSIAQFIAIANAKDLVFEVADNYQKQTYRNRTLIYAANGKLALTIPVKYSQKNRQLYRDIEISNTSNWQLLHWKSLESAYKTSPFFDYYEDELRPLFFYNTNKLLDHNFKCFETILDCLQLENLNVTTTTCFEKEVPHKNLRHLVNARKERQIDLSPYTQVFCNKHGFIQNLSILDLVFNEGPNALNYLESHIL